MGIYIGNETVGEVEVNFAAGVKSKDTYLGLTDRYNIVRRQDKYICNIGLEGWISKEAKLAGERALPIKGLGSVEIEISDMEFITPLGTTSIMAFLIGKVIPRLETIMPEWKGKLVLDF